MSNKTYLKQRHQTWYFRINIPVELQPFFDKKEHVESLQTRDLTLAQKKRWPLRDHWEAEFERARRNGSTDTRAPRVIYQEAIERFKQPDFIAYDADGPSVPLAVDLELDKLERAELKRKDYHPDDPLPDDILPIVKALTDTRTRSQGKKPKPRQEYAEPFSETAKKWFKFWKRGHDKDLTDPETLEKKETNTASQYLSTTRLFSGYWDDKPFNEVSHRDADEFRDMLSSLDPKWGRSSKTKDLSFKELMTLYQEAETGLGHNTINRHIRILKKTWKWAKKKEIVSGDNPFEDLHLKGKDASYKPWSISDLKKLATPPPQRRDMYEVFFIGLYSGLRINEIASLSWENLLEHKGHWIFDIVAGKSDAGVRRVPVHNELSWLLKKTRGNPQDYIWPNFNANKAGNNKPGEHASSLFGKHKVAHGFKGRVKAFHSLRKNITSVATSKDVQAHIWKQIMGHDRGLTFGIYNPDGVDTPLLKKVMDTIVYEGLTLPSPEEAYGDKDSFPHGYVGRTLRATQEA